MVQTPEKVVVGMDEDLGTAGGFDANLGEDFGQVVEGSDQGLQWGAEGSDQELEQELDELNQVER